MARLLFQDIQRGTTININTTGNSASLAEEVPGAIRGMKNKRISFRLYKILTYFQLIVLHDDLPLDWKLGYLTPILMKGSRDTIGKF